MSKFTNAPSGKMKVGLLVDSVSVSKYVYETVQGLLDQEELFEVHLIVQRAAPHSSLVAKLQEEWMQKGLNSLVTRIAFAILTRAENLILARTRNYRDHLTVFNLASLVTNQVEISPIISKSGLVYRHSDGDIKKLVELQFDVLVRCGSGILRGPILTAAKFGILSFHHGDNRINRGYPAGFWEVYHRKSSTGFVIQQLTEELDGGNVLVRGQFATKFCYLLNQASLYSKSNRYLQHLLVRMAASQKLPEKEPAQPYCQRLYTRPTLREQFVYVVKLAAHLLKQIFDKYLARNMGAWHVAYTRGGWRSLPMWKASVIANPPGHFLADPFVWRSNGEDYCFVEDFSSKKGLGCIAAYKLSDRGAERLGDAIAEPFHMSFPYLFEVGSALYMCPEISQSREIRLYESIDFPLKWKFSKTLMQDISAVDSMIFQFENRWWMLTNTDPIGLGDHSYELRAFFSDDPTSDEWTAHQQNPIFIDSAKARNAGLVRDGDQFFRVAQSQGFDRYGAGFSVNRIVKLNPTEYEEECICAVTPEFLPDLLGTHHLHSNGQTTVFDFFRK